MKRRSGDYLDRFQQSVGQYKALLQEAFEGVVAEDVSKYPVFIFHQQEVNVGIAVVDRLSSGLEWSVNVSTLEEFYIKGLVKVEQLDDIKQKIMQDHQYCCLVISGQDGNLIFIPRD